jgi:hypothetical protein
VFYDFTNIINLKTSIQTAVVIEDSATTADFVDDNPVVTAEVSSGHIESWTNSAVHGSVPSEDAHVVSIGYHEIFPV